MIFDRDNWQEIWSALGKNKLRTFLTALGVFWGIFMLIVMLGSGKGLENGVKSDFGNFATNSLYVWTRTTTKPYKGFPPGRWFGLNADDVEPLRRQFPDLEAVCGRLQLGGHNSESNVYYGSRNGPFEVNGDIPDFLKIAPRKIIQGRFINQKDLDEKRKIAVIGKRVKEVLFEPGEDPIGKSIRIQGVYFMVVGVFDLFNKSTGGEREDENIFIPLTSFQQAFNRGNRIGWLAIMSKPDKSVAALEPAIIRFLADRHDVHPDDARAFGHWSAEKEYVRMNNVFMGIRFLVWLVGIGTLAAGIIGVSNIMLIVVKERTKEIGIRKSIGATPFAIVSQIVLEALVLTAIAGYTGMLAGVYLIEGLNFALVQAGVEAGMFKNPEVDFGVVIKATIVLIFAGGMAGLLPARRAAQIEPVVALRNE